MADKLADVVFIPDDFPRIDEAVETVGRVVAGWIKLVHVWAGWKVESVSNAGCKAWAVA